MHQQFADLRPVAAIRHGAATDNDRRHDGTVLTRNNQLAVALCQAADPLLPESRHHLNVTGINKPDAGPVCHAALQNVRQFANMLLRLRRAEYCVINHGFATTSK
jgi:hypothetical protein